jgi:hypothetical protein
VSSLALRDSVASIRAASWASFLEKAEVVAAMSWESWSEMEGGRSSVEGSRRGGIAEGGNVNESTNDR